MVAELCASAQLSQRRVARGRPVKPYIEFFQLFFNGRVAGTTKSESSMNPAITSSVRRNVM